MSIPTCPKCSHHPALREEDVDGVRVHACADCNGVWLNQGELNALVHPAAGDLEYCSEDRPQTDRLTDHPCPLCPDTNMVQVNFIAYSGILMDHCRQCQGLWLDRGELDAITAEVHRLEQVPDSWTHRIMLFLAKLPF